MIILYYLIFKGLLKISILRKNYFFDEKNNSYKSFCNFQIPIKKI